MEKRATDHVNERIECVNIYKDTHLARHRIDVDPEIKQRLGIYKMVTSRVRKAIIVPRIIAQSTIPLSFLLAGGVNRMENS